MIKNGKVCLKATSEELLERMRGNVFTKKFKSEDEIKIIEKKYKVVNVQRGTGYIKVRFISHFKPNIEDLIEEEPTFEDVYIEYFELEDAK